MKSLLLVLLSVVLCLAEQGCEVNQRILGGEYAEEGEFPGVVFLKTYYQPLIEGKVHICGGSLISEFWVLTAAHCLTYSSKQFVFVNVFPARNSSDFIQSKNVIVHEGYGNYIHPNDIGLIRLPRSMSTIDPHFKTVSLPAQGQRLTSNEVTLVGWGMTSFTDKFGSLYLKKLEHVPFNQNLCQYADVSEAEMLCRYATMATGDVCSGDSGGPVFMDGQVVGIVSRSRRTSIGLLSLETRTSAYRAWIDTEIRLYEASLRALSK